LLFGVNDEKEEFDNLLNNYQKKEKKESPTITISTAEILKREAYSMTIKDDFLMDITDYEIPSIETTMEILDEKPTHSTAHYFGKELLNMIDLNTTMKDIFVLPPERKTRKLKEGAGYLLTKLKNNRILLHNPTMF